MIKRFLLKKKFIKLSIKYNVQYKLLNDLALLDAKFKAL